MHARQVAMVVVLAVSAISAISAMHAALAQAPGSPAPGPARGPGMMEGASSMMGGWHAPGMMGGWHGPGTIYGAGPGMRDGGWAAGDGRGWGQPDARRRVLDALGLDDDQRARIAQIQEESRRKHWVTLGEWRTERFRLQGLYAADRLDERAIVEQQRKVDELQRQLLAARVAARNQISEVLSPEQRQRFRGFGPRWMRSDADD